MEYLYLKYVKSYSRGLLSSTISIKSKDFYIACNMYKGSPVFWQSVFWQLVISAISILAISILAISISAIALLAISILAIALSAISIWAIGHSAISILAINEVWQWLIVIASKIDG